VTAAVVVGAVPPSSKSAQSNLGPPIAFATGWIKVASGDLTPHAGRSLKPSKYGNSGRYGTLPDY